MCASTFLTEETAPGLTQSAFNFHAQPSRDSPWGPPAKPISLSPFNHPAVREKVNTNVFHSPLSYDNRPVVADHGAIGSGSKKVTPETSIVDASGFWQQGRRDTSSTMSRQTSGISQEHQSGHLQSVKPRELLMESAAPPMFRTQGRAVKTQPPPVAEPDIRMDPRFLDAVRQIVFENKDRVDASVAQDQQIASSHSVELATHESNLAADGDVANVHLAPPTGTTLEKSITPTGPALTSWARIAALKGTIAGADEAQGPVKIVISSKPVPTQRTSPVKRFPYESEAQQLRVVFVSHLPRGFTALDVSNGIQTGGEICITL